MLIGEFAASLVTVTLPDTVAADAGVNETPSVAVCPAPIICPATTPDELNPAPVTLTDPTVTVELPLFVSVTLLELLLATATFPNARLAALLPSDFVTATPVPESAIAVGDPAALLTSETEPDTAPAAAGPNATLNVVLLPAAIVAGIARLLILNPEPETVAREIVNAAVPLF